LADKERGDDNVVVIGLGRFGGAVAGSLQKLGHEVLGIDNDPKLVQEWSERLTHVAEADSTDEALLPRLDESASPTVSRRFTRA